MAARCAVCGKGPQTGFTVSHSHIRNKRTFRPNLQPVRTTIDGENVRGFALSDRPQAVLRRMAPPRIMGNSARRTIIRS